ncbi:MAG: hypothetical protein JNN00_06665 [Chitinophagaceae bacterium]|nr:hypothetical protein [Chitinophagaceae bacterium]
MNETVNTKTTTLGGTVTVFLANINSGDVVKTMVLAAIGATVSFGMSHVLKWVVRRVRKWRPPKSS